VNVRTIDASPSNNGRGSDAWFRPWMHFTADRRSPGYCRVTFDHPPVNTVTARTVAELAELVELIERDLDLNVVVFDSANPDHYLGGSDPARREWRELLAHLSRAPVLSIASIRGRVCGAGSGFVLACDLRFASREHTLLGRLETGSGDAPAATLSHLVGRGRALELLLVDGDFDGPRAERYGYVNRLIADDQLDDEVDRIASRLARLDHDAVARTKSYVDQATLARR
jgi:enoyl-CoA hydratase/carnithine racemase